MSYQEQTTTDQTVAPNTYEQLATQDLYDTAASDGLLKNFLDLVNAAGLAAVLHSPDLHTVLAPSNEALREANPDNIERAALHVLRGAFTAAELKSSPSVKTITGKALPIASRDGEIRVGGVRLVRTDVECTNGVLHIVDGLIQQP